MRVCVLKSVLFRLEYRVLRALQAVSEELIMGAVKMWPDRHKAETKGTMRACSLDMLVSIIGGVVGCQNMTTAMHTHKPVS